MLHVPATLPGSQLERAAARTTTLERAAARVWLWALATCSPAGRPAQCLFNWLAFQQGPVAIQPKPLPGLRGGQWSSRVGCQRVLPPGPRWPSGRKPPSFGQCGLAPAGKAASLTTRVPATAVLALRACMVSRVWLLE